MRCIIAATAFIAITGLVSCADWMTQQRPAHQPDIGPDGSAVFPAHELLGRTIETLHPDTCPVPPEEQARLETNGYRVVNGFARENDPTYGRDYPSWVCIRFAGPGLMRQSMLAATTYEGEIIASEVTFRPPENSQVTTIYADLEDYFETQCSQCTTETEEHLVCLDCASAPRIQVAVDRDSAIEKIAVGYFTLEQGLTELRPQASELGSDYFGF